ncbi:MAG: glycosyltransferase family 2 protein [Bacilli bacterium]
MFIFIYFLLSGITITYGLYFIITSLFAFKKSKVIKELNPSTYFSILVAARNEEKVIGNLIKSLKQQDYPKELYEINIIVNNCDDDTKGQAIKAGANVIECTAKTHSKGEVLQWIIKEFKSRKGIDAYVVFDADNVVHPDFLKNMNTSYLNGIKVAQGFRDTKNISDSWLSSSYALYYYFLNFFYNKARINMNLSASLNGTGFYFDKEIAQKYFKTKTITEDMEFTGICAINNIKIGFVENAVTYDEQATGFKESWTQRKRWSIGIMACTRRYYKKLFNSIFKKGSFASLDILLVYLSSFIQVLSFILLLAYCIYTVSSISLIKVTFVLLFINILLFVSFYIISLFVSIFVIKYYKKDIKACLKGVIFFTIFMFTWIPINIVCLFTKKIKWYQIKHHRDIGIESLTK